MIQNIFIGDASNDKTGKPARQAGQIINANFAYLDAKISNVDKIIAQTGHLKIGQDLTYNADWVWHINGLQYTNPVAIEFVAIPFTSSGKERFDVFALTTSNTFLRIAGPESDPGIVDMPDLPVDMIQAGVIKVTDSSVGDPTLPVLGENYVKKMESQDFIVDYGATTVIEQIDLTDDRSSISLANAVTDIKSIQVSGEFLRPGKPHFVKNRTGHDVTIWHDAGTGNVKYFFPNELDLVVKPNEVIQFNTNANDSGDLKLEFVNNTPIAYEKTGTVISLNNVIGNYYNMNLASNEETLTYQSEVLGGIAFRLINCANEPTITGALKITKGNAFVADTDMYLVAKYNGFRVDYWFESIGTNLEQYLGLPFGAILTESITPTTDFYGDPCILKTSSGRYIYSHSVFGTGADTKKTRIRYTDELTSNSWILSETFTAFIWGTLFEYSGDIYIIGCSDYPLGGVIKISKSTDDGETWSTPVQILSIPSPYEGWTTAPINGIIKDGYFVKVFELREGSETFAQQLKETLVFGDLTDLMNSSSWSYSNVVPFNGTAFANSGIFSNTTIDNRPSAGASKGFLEGNLVEKDNGDLIVLSRLEQAPCSNHAVYLDVIWDAITPTDSTIDTTHNFINMYGGNVKFQVFWDATSSKHWSVVNLNKARYYSDGRLEAYLIASNDNCETWENYGKVSGYNLDIGWEIDIPQYATQYSYFIIEGNDLLIAQRSANIDADTWHNANLITLTRIQNFRSLTAETYIEGSLIIDENSVRIEDSNGISIIQDQSKYYNSPYMLTADNASKVDWVSGLNFTGSEFMKVIHDRSLNLDNGFSVFCVIENLQSTTGLRILSKSNSTTSDGKAGDYSFSIQGMTIGTAIGNGFTDISTSNDYIVAASYDNVNNFLYNYLNGTNRGNPPTKTNCTWDTDHLVITPSLTIGNFNDLYIGKRIAGTPVNFTSKIKALHIIPNYMNPTDMVAYQAALNAIYSIY